MMTATQRMTFNWSSFKQWMRVVLPPVWYVRAFVGIYVFISGFCYWVLYTISNLSPDLKLRASPLLTREMVVIFAAVIYGIYRACAFQPLYRNDYLRFLKQTAWTPKKPFPLGPVHLVWQDLFVMAVLMLMVAYLPVFHPTRVFSLGLGAYLLFFSRGFLQFGLWKPLYQMLFTLGLSIAFWPDPLLSAGIMLIAYIIAFRNLELSCVKLHEADLDDLTSSVAPGPRANQKRTIDDLYARKTGWPFDVLAPRKPSTRMMNRDIHGISTQQGFILSLLAGWWAFAITVAALNPVQQFMLAQFGHGEPRSAIIPHAIQVVWQEIHDPINVENNSDAVTGIFMILNLCLLVIVVTRLTHYLAGYNPPMNLNARWKLRQWLIRDYDRVFLAPLCMIFTAMLVYPTMTYAMGISPLFSGPLTLGLILAEACNLGPGRVAWQLTAPCQIVATAEYRNHRFSEFQNS